MLLAIDIGNTNIVIGCIEGEKICHELRLATDLVKTSDQYWMDLKGVLALYDLQASEIEGVIISSVVPPVLNSLRTAVMKLTGRSPMVVGPGLKTGLNIATLSLLRLRRCGSIRHHLSSSTWERPRRLWPSMRRKPFLAAASARASKYHPRCLQKELRSFLASVWKHRSTPLAAIPSSACKAALCWAQRA